MTLNVQLRDNGAGAFDENISSGILIEHYYQEVTDSDSTQSTTDVAKVTLTFTPSVQADYLIIATANLGSYLDGTTWYPINANLKIDGTIYGAFSGALYDINWWPFSAIRVVNLSAASHTITLNYSTSDGTGSAKIWHARIMAIKLDGTQKSGNANDTMGYNATTNYVASATTGAFTPSTVQNWVLIATAGITNSDTPDTYIRVYDVDSATVHEESNEMTDVLYTWGMMRRISNLSASQHTFRIEYKTGNVSGTAGIQYANIILIPETFFTTAAYNEQEGSVSPAADSTWYTRATTTYTAEARDYLILGSGNTNCADDFYAAIKTQVTDGTDTNNKTQLGSMTTGDITGSLMMRMVTHTAGSKTAEIDYYSFSNTNPSFSNMRIYALEMSYPSLKVIAVTSTTAQKAIKKGVHLLPKITSTTVQKVVKKALHAVPKITSTTVQAVVKKAVHLVPKITSTTVQAVVKKALHLIPKITSTTAQVITGIKHVASNLYYQTVVVTSTAAKAVVRKALHTVPKITSTTTQSAVKKALHTVPKITSTTVQAVVKKAMHAVPKITSTTVQKVVKLAKHLMPKITSTTVQVIVKKAMHAVPKITSTTVQKVVKLAKHLVPKITSTTVQKVIKLVKHPVPKITSTTVQVLIKKAIHLIPKITSTTVQKVVKLAKHLVPKITSTTLQTVIEVGTHTFYQAVTVASTTVLHVVRMPKKLVKVTSTTTQGIVKKALHIIPKLTSTTVQKVVKLAPKRVIVQATMTVGRKSKVFKTFVMAATGKPALIHGAVRFITVAVTGTMTVAVVVYNIVVRMVFSLISLISRVRSWSRTLTRTESLKSTITRTESLKSEIERTVELKSK